MNSNHPALISGGLFFVIGLLSRSAGAGFGMAVGVFLNAILIAGVAGPLIGPCPSPMMHCHSITQPVLIVAAAVIAVIALIEIRRLASR